MTRELFLTEEERRLLVGEAGPAARKAMELLVALGRIHGADRLVPVRSVQVSGVSYHNLGEAGLAFLEEMAETGRVQVETATLNPAGMDLDTWREMGVPPEFAQGQRRILEAYARMGVATVCTCTPYLAGNLPVFGESVAWAESSAVTFANSVLGARTNREGGPAALAAALVGRIPRWGLHLEENRRPNLRVALEDELPNAEAWGLLGAFLGRQRPGCLPLVEISGRRPTLEDLKSLSAALPTYGGQPMFHVVGVTPEADGQPVPDETLVVRWSDLRSLEVQLQDPVDRVDMVCLGCPHGTLAEVRRLVELLDGRRAEIPVWMSVSRAVYEAADRLGYPERLREAGALLVRDTCFVVAPLRGRVRAVATNSPKGCYYAHGQNRLQVRLGDLEQCVESAVRGGRWEEHG